MSEVNTYSNIIRDALAAEVSNGVVSYEQYKGLVRDVCERATMHLRVNRDNAAKLLASYPEVWDAWVHSGTEPGEGEKFDDVMSRVFRQVAAARMASYLERDVTEEELRVMNETALVGRRAKDAATRSESVTRHLKDNAEAYEIGF